MPPDKPYLQPFWLAQPTTGSSYTIDRPELRDRPDDPPFYVAAFEIQAGYEKLTLRRSDVHLVASHFFGTACASGDPRSGVVSSDLSVHGRENLFVMDASVFPTNLGVNPQHSIMGLVAVASEQLAERASSSRAA